MAGGGSRRDGGKVQVTSTNGFAALGSLRKKKKSGTGSGKGSSKSQSKSAGEIVQEEKPKVVWAPTPLVAKSWADVEDDEDDDYFATTAPPQMMWGTARQEEMGGSSKEETNETESEDDILEYGDEDEDEPEQEHEIPVPAEPVQMASPAPIVSKETERQLSKKELKKKELAELDAVLAEFGIANKEEVKPPQQQEDSSEKKETAPPPLPSESKASKKKKKKATKEAKGLLVQPNGTSSQGSEEATGSDRGVDNGSQLMLKKD